MPRLPSRIYVAVIGDLISSRDLPDRRAVQRRLQRTLRRLNREWESGIAASFLITLGDEFQGLLTEPAAIDRMLAGIRRDLHPVEVRFGIGIGRLATRLEKEAIGMDGPCFHRARAALERAESRASIVEVEAETNAAAFRIYGALSSALRRQWSERQRQVFDLAATGLSGRAVAKKLKIQPSAVSQHLTAAEAHAVLEAQHTWLIALCDAAAAARGKE